ncbi:general substrate transporter [Aspergillus keveii]|uniref:General substrate transporter n=1 Tax=Aspergillus keveii TaxID=714993 RepID=A0ABR4FRT9_9EURO
MSPCFCIRCGMLSIVTPLYQSEVSPARERGRMVGAHGILVVTGYACAAWTGYGCYFEANPEVQWRLCLSLQAVAPLLLLIATPRIPESPRWLIAHGQRDRALKILNRLQPSTEGNIESATETFTEICAQIAAESENRQSFFQSLKNSQSRKRFLCLAQSSGILVISNYQVLLWNNLGLYGYLPLLLYSVYTSWAAFLNWVASRIIDRIGRVRMMVIGLSGCVVMLACYTAMVAEYSGSDNKAGNVMGIVFLFLHLTFYATFVDVTSYVYCSEIFPTNQRAQGVAVSIVGLFMMTLIYTEAASTAFAHVGWKYYLVFILVPAAGVPLIAQFPETKGLSLEGSAALFGAPEPKSVALGKTQVQYIEDSTSTEHVQDVQNGLGRG